MEWINKLNEMLEENPYTNGNRVTVEYSPIANGVRIDVCGKSSVISADNLTEYGLMMEIMMEITMDSHMKNSQQVQELS